MAKKTICDICGKEMERLEATVEIRFADESDSNAIHKVPDWRFLDVHFKHLASLAKRLNDAVKEHSK